MTDTPRRLLHTTRMSIRWGDMDAYGHVNNTVYFRYAEQARIEWLEGCGYGVGPEHEDAPVIINASCTFLVPLTYPGTIEVRTFVGHIGRSSFTSHFEMRLEGDDTLYAEGASKIVWMMPATGKSVPLPETLRRLLEGGV